MKMRRPIIAGNWKLHKTIREAQELVNALKQELQGIEEVEIAVCPPYTCLSEVSKLLLGSNIQLGAQDVYWEDYGAYTGEVSVPMLKEIGCRYVIIGHSERRIYFGETDEMVNKKVKAVLKHNLHPIVCIGESGEQREAGQTYTVIEGQLRQALQAIAAEQMKSVVIAYEPVWAIGTGRTASPEQAQEAHSFIRRQLEKLYNREIAESVRIQYGGSIKPENIAHLMAQPDVDGGLVGGASLKLDSFVRIVQGAK